MQVQTASVTTTERSPGLDSIAIVIPCYRVRRHILEVIAGLPDQVEGAPVDLVLVIDDACPEGSGEHVHQHCRDPRVVVLRHERNAGVGAAMVTGYREALARGATVVVKLDGDGQMDPGQLPDLLAPVLGGEADYTKGNRFFDVEVVGRMPVQRLLGNAILSFMSKASSGYWNLFDPTNGYTAIHAAALRRLPLDKLSPRYFFETDLLFRLNTVGAVVEDVPMPAVYGEETSNLRIGRIIGPFLAGHLRNFSKRIVYNYFLRDFSVASLQLVSGLGLLVFGAAHGGYHWWRSIDTGVASPTGTIIIAALSLLAGLQLLLAFLAYDMNPVPRRPLQRRPLA